MISIGPERNALNTLLKIAREEHAVLREDLADLAAARKAAELSLEQLRNGAGPQAGEQALLRRRRIEVMLATYEQAETEAREKISTAVERTHWLEGLLGQASSGNSAAA